MTFFKLTTYMAASTKNDNLKSDAMEIGERLQESLLEGKTDRRIMCGIVECAKVLEISPDEVMFCLLPLNPDAKDVTFYIEHTLIEAFCRENEIRLLKVDSSTKLSCLLDDAERRNDNRYAHIKSHEAGCSCVLVLYPDGEYSPADKSVIDYHYNAIRSNVFQTPRLALPD